MFSPKSLAERDLSIVFCVQHISLLDICGARVVLVAHRTFHGAHDEPRAIRLQNDPVERLRVGCENGDLLVSLLPSCWESSLCGSSAGARK